MAVSGRRVPVASGTMDRSVVAGSVGSGKKVLVGWDRSAGLGTRVLVVPGRSAGLGRRVGLGKKGPVGSEMDKLAAQVPGMRERIGAALPWRVLPAAG
jgi:hypothetical protein